jgi:transcription antitermination factor NusG
MHSWYLLCHKAGLDNFRRACTILRQQQHIRLVSPMITTRRSRPDRPAVRQVEEPLFYGYLFIELDFEITHSSVIEELPGVSHFVRCGQKIRPVPQQVISEIIALPVLQSEQQALQRARLYKHQAGTSVLRHRILELAEISDRNVRSALFLALVESAQH